MPGCSPLHLTVPRPLLPVQRLVLIRSMSLLSYEEKTTYKIANPAPDLSEKTSPYYQTAFQVDQHASINMAAARQRHVDQGQSFNFYVRPDIKATEFLELHLHAWRAGMKSTYYVRSRALTIEES